MRSSSFFNIIVFAYIFLASFADAAENTPGAASAAIASASSSADTLKSTGRTFADQGHCAASTAIDRTAATRACSDSSGSQSMMVLDYINGVRACIFIDSTGSRALDYFVPVRTYQEYSAFAAHLPPDTRIVYGCETTTVPTGCGLTMATLPEARNGTELTIAGSATKKTTYVCEALSGCGIWKDKASEGSCTATSVEGVCGSANGGTFTSEPSSGLCSSGTPTALTDWEGRGVAWYWHCIGDSGGVGTYCTARNTPINGVCGPADRGWSDTSPTSGLCSVGTPTSPTDWHGLAWYWHCMGEHGGGYVYCSIRRSGPTTCTPYWTSTSTGPCSASCGGGQQDVNWIDGCGGNKVTTRTCNTEACTSGPRPVDGVCSGASGGSFGSAPGSDLCAAGAPDGVTDWYGEAWYWHCIGTNGGGWSYCPATRQ